jgi:hypothetical protein
LSRRNRIHALDTRRDVSVGNAFDLKHMQTAKFGDLIERPGPASSVPTFSSASAVGVRSTPPRAPTSSIPWGDRSRTTAGGTEPRAACFL